MFKVLLRLYHFFDKNKPAQDYIEKIFCWLIASLASLAHNERVKRWTNRINIFSYQFVLMPILENYHGSLVVIDVLDKQVNFYDSMQRDSQNCLIAVRDYIQQDNHLKVIYM